MDAHSGVALVGVAPLQDRAHELVTLVASRLNKDPSSFPQVTSDASLREFIQTMLAASSTILASSLDDEVENYFILILSLVNDLPASQFAELVQRIAGILLSGGLEDKAALRLRIIVNVYNFVSDVGLKFQLFTSILRFADDSKQFEPLVPYFSAAITALKQSGVSDAEVRPVFHELSRSLFKIGEAEQAQSFLIRYLATFEGESNPAVVAESREAAREAALGYIRAPAVSQRSALLHLKAIQALASDSKYAQLHELLTIFATKDLDAYATFYGANARVVESMGIAHDASVETMRLLTLCSLASAKPALPYETVATTIKLSFGLSPRNVSLFNTEKLMPLASGLISSLPPSGSKSSSPRLQCDINEVESWIVKAVTRGLIDAKMDQSTSVVTVTRAVQREFGPVQWLHLQTTLRAWRDHVSSLLQAVDTHA